MISVKSREELDHIRRAGRIVAKTLKLLKKHLRAGITTEELDRIAKEFIEKNGAISAFKNYKGFPGEICISCDNIIVHGIPDENTKIKEGSIVSIDVGIKLGGYFADSAITFAVGKMKDSTKKLLKVTEEALYKGIEKARVGNRLGDISFAIQDFVESRGFSIVRDFVGHGVGYELHEEPEIPNFGKPNTGIRLEEGMVLAIEPMVNEGEYETKILDDGWTVVTKDGSLSCHFEHTISITKGKPEILTK